MDAQGFLTSSTGLNRLIYSIGGLAGNGGGVPHPSPSLSLVLSVGDIGPIAFAFPALTVGSRIRGDPGGLERSLVLDERVL